MFRTFIVPLDGSQLAERALPYAVQLARARQGRLVLMRAALAPPPRGLDGSDLETDQRRAVDDAEQYLHQIAQRLVGQVSVDTTAPYGHAADQILRTAASFEADAIIMATHGRTGLQHMLHGSVTERVLAGSQVPVFALYTQSGGAPPPTFPAESARLLVPQDGSAYDGAAVATALEMIGPRGQLVLLTAIQVPEQVRVDEVGRIMAYLDQEVEVERMRAQDYLHGIAAELEHRPNPVQVTVDVRVGDGHPASKIVAAAKQTSCELIVMATHGRTGIHRAVLGSVAGEVLRGAPVPLLLVHPHAVAQATDEKREAVAPLAIF